MKYVMLGLAVVMAVASAVFQFVDDDFIWSAIATLAGLTFTNMAYICILEERIVELEADRVTWKRT